MNENRLLEQAQKAIRDGNKELGKELLIQVLEENPDNEAAWLWMSAAVDTPELRQECLEKVLEINPQNQHARKGLAKVLYPQRNPRFHQQGIAPFNQLKTRAHYAEGF